MANVEREFEEYSYRKFEETVAGVLKTQDKNNKTIIINDEYFNSEISFSLMDRYATRLYNSMYDKGRGV
ncbi:MAG: hypothetical protein ACM3KR_01905 [Deltaproteobacteria bacterium]